MHNAVEYSTKSDSSTGSSTVPEILNQMSYIPKTSCLKV